MDVHTLHSGNVEVETSTCRLIGLGKREGLGLDLPQVPYAEDPFLMESLPWLLLIVTVAAGIAAIVPLSRTYVALKDNVAFAIDEIRDHLHLYRDELRRINLEYMQKYSVDDAEPYGSKARSFQKELTATHNRIFESIESHRDIRQRIPSAKTNSIDYILFGLQRIIQWNQASNKLNALRRSIREHEKHVNVVAQALYSIDRLPLDIADLARTTRNLSYETKVLLEALCKEQSVGGQAMTDALRSVDEVETRLGEISTIFYTLPAEKLLVTPSIKLETQKVYRILVPDRTVVEGLYSQAQTWKSTLAELKRTVQVTQEQLDEAEAKFTLLDNYLVLSSEQEELSLLRQKVAQIRSILQSPAVETLNAVFAEAQQALAALKNLNAAFSDYQAKLDRLRGLVTKVNQQVQLAESSMNTLAARHGHPVLWTGSRTALQNIKRDLALIPSLTQRRTPADLKGNLSIVESCDVFSVRLLSTIEEVRSELTTLIALWQQLQLDYSETWLERVKELFAEIEKYDIAKNWDQQDHARSLLADGLELKGRVKANIPLSTSIPIDEQSIQPKLLVARELAEKKPIYEQRRQKITARLLEVRQDEQAAAAVFARVAPAVTQLSKEIRSATLPIPAAQELLIANDRTQPLEGLLRQRKVGKIKEKLVQMRAWEKHATENSLIIYKWVHNDVQQKQRQLKRHLAVITSFAADLEDAIVVQAHQYERELVKLSLDTVGVQKATMESLQKESSELLLKRRNLIECDARLSNFIGPVAEYYENVRHSLNQLRTVCGQLQKRFGRGWPPVFQSLRTLRMKIDALDEDLRTSRTRKWKKDDLMKRYDDLKSALRQIEVNIREKEDADKRDVDEITTLVEQHRKLTRDLALKRYGPDKRSIDQMIRTENEHLDVFLPNAYRYGVRDSNGNPRKWSPAQIKYHLRERSADFIQQIINLTNVNARDISVRQDMNRP